MSTMNLFAEALWRFYETGHADLWIERDDGYLHREDASWYFTTARAFPEHERAALQFAVGRVLDIGCGAGRHSLYLQRRGLSVTALDLSPRIIELARTRGVRDVRVADALARLPFRAGEFDTVILFGNNLGIGGTEPKLRALLRELHRVTSPRGRILGASVAQSRNCAHCCANCTASLRRADESWRRRVNPAPRTPFTAPTCRGMWRADARRGSCACASFLKASTARGSICSSSPRPM